MREDGNIIFIVLLTCVPKYLNLSTFSVFSFSIITYLFPSSSVFPFVIIYFVLYVHL